MRRVERELVRWRAVLVRDGRLSADQLEELEDHLRSSVEAALDRGEEAENALTHALTLLGDAHLIAAEFERESPHMSLASKLVGTLIVLVLLVSAIGSIGNLSLFVHVPAFLLVVGLVVGGIWACFGPRELYSALAASLGGRHAADPSERERHLALFTRGYQLAWAAGVLGTLIGVVLFLQNLTDPSQIGPGLALSLLSLFYGALLAELGFRSLTQWLRNRVASAS